MADTQTGRRPGVEDFRRNIFVVGMPRSGTTWLAKIFDSHPSTLYRHEPDSSMQLSAIPFVEPEIIDAAMERAAREELFAMLRQRRPRVSGRLPIFRKDFRSALGNVAVPWIAWLSKAASRAGVEIDVPDMVARGAVRPVWKSVESASRIGMIGRVLPESRIVHIVRHPCGYVASVERGVGQGRFYRTEEGDKDEGMFEILLGLDTAKRRGLTIADVDDMSPLEYFTWRWILVTEYALEAVAQLPNATTIRYEDLCVDPMKHTRDLFAFTGLDFGEQTEKFIAETTSRSDDDAYFSLYRDPLKAATKWKDEMRPESIDTVLNLVAQSPAGELFSDISGPRPERKGGETAAALA